jgi:hypothetical protein
MEIGSEKATKRRNREKHSPSTLFSFLHLRTLPTKDGVSLPASTSASMILVKGGSLNGSTL